jgi:hypothetical protein
MTPDQIIDLLTLAAAFDQRTVGDADTEAWLAVADVEHWTRELAHRALIEHYRANAARGRVTPAHISDRIREARDRVRLAAVHRDLTPPRQLADNPRAEAAWRVAEAARLVAAGMARWAATGELPAIDQPDAAPVRAIPEQVRALIGGAFAMPGRGLRRGAPDPSERAALRAAARAELAARGPARLPEEIR